VRVDVPRRRGQWYVLCSTPRREVGRPCTSHINSNVPVDLQGYEKTKRKARYGIEKGDGIGSTRDIKVSLKFLSCGLDCEMRVAPATSVSSLGCLTIVKWRKRSFGKSRMPLANES